MTSVKVCHFKLVLLGDTAVGKSCLVVRFVRDEFFEYQEPTIGGEWNNQKNSCEAKLITCHEAEVVPLELDVHCEFPSWGIGYISQKNTNAVGKRGQREFLRWKYECWQIQNPRYRVAHCLLRTIRSILLLIVLLLLIILLCTCTEGMPEPDYFLVLVLFWGDTLYIQQEYVLSVWKYQYYTPLFIPLITLSNRPQTKSLYSISINSLLPRYGTAVEPTSRASINIIINISRAY